MEEVRSIKEKVVAQVLGEDSEIQPSGKVLTQAEVEKMDTAAPVAQLRCYVMFKIGQRVESVAEQRRIYERARQIYTRCPGAHPEAVLDFCMDCPDAGPDEFQELKEKMQSVFRLEGARILYNIPAIERCRLVGTPLADVHAAFQKRDRRAIIRSYLEKSVTSETAGVIIDHPSFQDEINSQDFESDVAEKLAQCWTDKGAVKKLTFCRKRSRSVAFTPSSSHEFLSRVGNVVSDMS